MLDQLAPIINTWLQKQIHVHYVLPYYNIL